MMAKELSIGGTCVYVLVCLYVFVCVCVCARASYRVFLFGDVDSLVFLHTGCRAR